MNNYYGQLPPQYNNKHINNRMVNDYQRVVKNNTPFSGNQMLNNNPTFFHNLNDASFYHKMNMEKMEKMKKVKSVDELGLGKDKLTEYVICPIKVEKENGKELSKKYNDKSTLYYNPKKKNTINKDAWKEVSESIKSLWGGRTNNPYKNILKTADYSKKFKNKDDLVIHKVTTLDKNLIKTMAEFEEMIDFIDIHNGELRIKYSDKKKSKYEEKFDYENKIKYRIKYDPKNYSELKKFYKKEQKKLKKANRRVDEMIEMLLASENFTKAELEEIAEPIGQMEEDEIDENITMVFEKGDAKLEKRLEQELEEELAAEFGEENLDELIREHIGENKKHSSVAREKIRIKDSDKNLTIDLTKNKTKTEDTDSDEKPQKKKPLITVKNKKEILTNNLTTKPSAQPESNQMPDQIPTKKRITLKPKKIMETNNSTESSNKTDKTKQSIGQVDNDELEEFRKQKKTKK